MTTANIQSLLAGFMARRCEYLAFVGRRSADARPPLGETDYVLVWSLLSQSKMSTIHVDDPVVAALFRQAAPLSGLDPLAVHLPEDLPAPRDHGAGATSTGLYLFHPGNRLPPAWLAAATGPGAMAFCYGLTGILDGACIGALQSVGRDRPQSLYVSLSALAPPLWRATSLLVADSVHRATLEQIVQHWTETFAGEDLDVFRLAEENLALRVRRAPDERLQEQLATLEAQVAALRRTALAQEAKIAELTAQPARCDRPPANGNARLPWAAPPSASLPGNTPR